ncbi:MAG: ATP-dependent helicase C-terminal domain-containing protein, partial [Rhizobiaceae bacterium]
NEVVGSPWPDLSEEHLVETLDDWLAPFLDGKRSLESLATGALSDALMLLAKHPPKTELDRLVPAHYVTPAGSTTPLVYADKTVKLSVRPQELFGLDHHPTILDGRLPFSIELLSPAGRPVQLTQDLPGFWRGSWTDVRTDLRGRYPKHPWPEDPLNAEPTRRAKPSKR